MPPHTRTILDIPIEAKVLWCTNRLRAAVNTVVQSVAKGLANLFTQLRCLCTRAGLVACTL